jgi:hypothetical protein
MIAMPNAMAPIRRWAGAVIPVTARFPFLLILVDATLLRCLALPRQPQIPLYRPFRLNRADGLSVKGPEIMPPGKCDVIYILAAAGQGGNHRHAPGTQKPRPGPGLYATAMPRCRYFV